MKSGIYFHTLRCMVETVADLIRKAGGVDAIAAASKRTRKPVMADAVHKWRRNGIPDEHWGIFVEAGVEVEAIFKANERLRAADKRSRQVA